MKTFLLILILYLSVSESLLAQKSGKYTITNVTSTKIKNKPVYLNVIDTINSKRTISKPSSELGGLKPLYPMAISNECLSGRVFVYIDCLKKEQTLISCCTNYLVEINDSIIEINTPEQFKQIYAPVEDKEEALSFAYALSGYNHLCTLYNFDFLEDEGSDYEIYKKELTPTSVKETKDGYEVILFSTYYGFLSYCSEITVYVAKEGDVKVLRTENLFNDRNFNLIIN